jgi:hypothetical protein
MLSDGRIKKAEKTTTAILSIKLVQLPNSESSLSLFFLYAYSTVAIAIIRLRIIVISNLLSI